MNKLFRTKSLNKISEGDAGFPSKSSNVILKLKLIAAVSILLLVIAQFSDYLPYIPPDGFHNGYWYIFFPSILILYSGYWLYKRKKFGLTSSLCLTLLIFFITFWILANLAVMPTRFFAREYFDKKVLVTNVRCLSHTRYSRSTKLSYIDNGKPSQVIRFSDYLCSYDPIFKGHVKENDHIILHGRKWWAGSYIDSIEAEGEIINIHGTKWWLEQFIEKNYLLPRKDSDKK